MFISYIIIFLALIFMVIITYPVIKFAIEVLFVIMFPPIRWVFISLGNMLLLFLGIGIAIFKHSQSLMHKFKFR